VVNHFSLKDSGRNMEAIMIDEDDILEKTIFHQDYSVEGKENMRTIPTEPAVFGIFGMIHEKPVHCRYVGETENLRETIINLFEKAEEVSEGFAKYMHDTLIKRMLYVLMPGSTQPERQKEAEEWTQKYQPACDENGRYPKKPHRRSERQ
jgi:hypothetical protein